MIENGFAHLPGAAPRLAFYLHELTNCPKGPHDLASVLIAMPG
jgi:hypothetical protein